MTKLSSVLLWCISLRDPRVKCHNKLCFNKTLANKRPTKQMFYDSNIKCPIIVFSNKTKTSKRPIKFKVIKNPSIVGTIKFCYNKTVANKRSIKLMSYDLTIKCPFMVYPSMRTKSQAS
jgi:hypothetical protein